MPVPQVAIVGRPNVGKSSLLNWLAGNRIAIVDETSGNTFSFANDYILSEGEYVVVCYDTTKFKEYFPKVRNYVGNLNFGLDEAGEHLSLYNADGSLVDSLSYEDSHPWAIEPDGMGQSLELVNPSLNNAVAKSWSASTNHRSTSCQGMHPAGAFCSIFTTLALVMAFPS